MKKLQTLTATSAIALASVGGTAFAQEAQVTPVPSDTAVNESALVEKPIIEKSADVKPALDAQKKVVEQTKEQLTEAQSKADDANKQVSNAQSDVAKATEDVKHAEEVASKATPQNIEANKADQKANLADQEANAKETATADANIATQADAVSKAQTDEANAEQALKDANADVSAKETQVKSAKDAISGTGLAQAEDKLDEAKAETKGAEKNVTLADTALTDAKKADQKRQEAIDNAQKDVKVKSDIVETKKVILTNAQDEVKNTDIVLAQATDAVKKIEQTPNALVGENKTSIFSLNLFPEENTGIDLTYIPKTYVPSSHDEAVFESNVKRSKNLMIEAQIYFGNSRINIEEMYSKPYTFTDTKKWVDVRNMSFEDLKDINELAIRTLNDLREQKAAYDNSKFTPSQLSKGVIENAYNVAKAYMAKGFIDGHDSSILNKYNILSENIFGTGTSLDETTPSELTNFEKRKNRYYRTMAELKSAVIREIVNSTSNDAHAGWGHARHNTTQYPYTAIAFTITDKNALMMHTLSSAGIGVDTSDSADYMVTNRQYLDYLKSLTSKTDITKLKAEKDTAQTASEKANDALKQASTDYANALDLKTSAEKTLADATATPIQTTVAENNLRLAKLALDSAQKRQAEAQKAVDNFSADLASKKQALDDAKSALESAKRVQEQKVQALSDSKIELTKQESKLEALKVQKAKLIEEKDRLVKESKALEEKLKAYVEAPINLAKAQTTLAEKQDALKNAEAKAKSAKNLVDAIATTLEAEQVKLNKIQDKFDKLQDLEEKAKDNVIATLPDGTIVAIPNGSPTAEELPEFDINSLNKGLDDNKILAIDDKGNVTVNGQAYTSQQQVSSKPVYSRVERAKTLPETGEQESLFGLVGAVILSGIYLFGEIRKRKG